MLQSYPKTNVLGHVYTKAEQLWPGNYVDASYVNGPFLSIHVVNPLLQEVVARSIVGLTTL